MVFRKRKVRSRFIISNESKKVFTQLRQREKKRLSALTQEERQNEKGAYFAIVMDVDREYKARTTLVV